MIASLALKSRSTDRSRINWPRQYFSSAEAFTFLGLLLSSMLVATIPSGSCLSGTSHAVVIDNHGKIAMGPAPGIRPLPNKKARRGRRCAGLR